ncbi:hypothetical protein [Legionella maioricensis]|uniref:Uncharacterized protein n=1 Tax=Legionella maioricensis TaxID=2896528 RepID=A0A9X2CZI1_9GAMM|nr:hypothetical protein [Legionella maioricensis]MCL9683611.1 hypothetical protein [Legionella maioricensis]MCL9687633.1 hypothetical protein [Legionella maioricensis]
MRIPILIPTLLILFLFSFPSLYGYSETTVVTDSQLTMEKACITNGQDELRIKYSYIAEEDAKYITLYGCSCAYKEAQKSSLSIVGTNFRNARNCIYYAVLRNAMRYKAAPSSEENRSAGILKSCVSSFPRDLKDDSINEDISIFCKCASIPTEKISEEIKPLKLNEDQIYEKLITVISGCR